VLSSDRTSETDETDQTDEIDGTDGTDQIDGTDEIDRIDEIDECRHPPVTSYESTILASHTPHSRADRLSGEELRGR